MHFDLWKLADFHIIHTLLFLAAAWRWGDWRNWQKYYPTMLFYILLSFAYGYITYNHPLWEYESPLLKTTLSDIFFAMVGGPSAVLLFLSHYPNGIYKRIIYFFIWVTLFSIMELISLKLGFFSHLNGWNIWSSIVFDCFMFPLLRLHHKNPLRAWSITIFLTIAILYGYGFSFSSMK